MIRSADRRSLRQRCEAEIESSGQADKKDWKAKVHSHMEQALSLPPFCQPKSQARSLRYINYETRLIVQPNAAPPVLLIGLPASISSSASRRSLAVIPSTFCELSMRP